MIIETTYQGATHAIARQPQGLMAACFDAVWGNVTKAELALLSHFDYGRRTHG